MVEPKSIIFDLSENLTYADTTTGTEAVTAQVEMFAPTRATAKACHKLASRFMRASLQIRNLNTEEPQDVNEDEAITADAIYVIFSSSNIEFSEVEDIFAENVGKVCFLDSNKKVPMTTYLFNKLSLEDAKNMVCSYIANFIVPFALRMKK